MAKDVTKHLVKFLTKAETAGNKLLKAVESCKTEKIGTAIDAYETAVDVVISEAETVLADLENGDDR